MRLNSGGAIDRSHLIRFFFDGVEYAGHPGDTLASALLANGVRLIGRSFKYHRPRGIYSAGWEEPNALVTVTRGSTWEPNIQATTLELFEGLTARSQNRWPSLRVDLMGVNQWISPLIPAGFYYKTFMWPRGGWRLYERFIRRAAGMGRASRGRDLRPYERSHSFCDVLVVGGGPAGLAAAWAAGRSGARVVLLESEPVLGGGLWRDDETLDGVGAHAWLQRVSAGLQGLSNVQVSTRTTAFAYFDNNVLAALERVTDHLGTWQPAKPRQRLHVIRAKRVVLATGAMERPLVFENNDLPGVMLAGSVRTYLNRFAVAPGRRAVVFTNNDDAYRTAIALHRAGAGVRAVVDSRPSVQGVLPGEVRRLGIECLAGYAVLRARGRQRIDAVELVSLSDSRSRRAATRRLDCDLLAVSGGWSPAVHLHSQSGGRVSFDEAQSAFVPGAAQQAASSAGAAAGSCSLAACRAGGDAAGRDAAAAAGFDPGPAPALQIEATPGSSVEPLWIVPGARKNAFVDIQDDVTSADVELAHREGYVSVEHLKRYTTLGMGTDQGKTSNLNGLALMASLQGRTIAQTGATTFRPPYVPVALGAFAGREVGQHHRPIRRTAMHDWHIHHGAQMVEAGLWMRPRSYPHSGESARDAYIREAAHVRKAVGLVDVSTLGKIDIQGPGSIELLERAYANNWRSLGIGRARYGLMLREDGTVLDDGTTARLGEHHYLMTTTTANAAKVLAHLEFLLQAVWPELRAHVTSVTEQWATMALAGPGSRSVLAGVIEGGATAAADLALPHLGIVSSRVAGVPCRVSRVSYSGERAYEIAAPADLALPVWEAILEAGRGDSISPYGTEAMGALRIEKGHIAGPELDGRTTADDLGLGALLSTKKDFIGRRLSQRPALRSPDRAQLVGLVPLDRRLRLRSGAQIVETARPAGVTPMVGHVSSVTYSPELGHDVALALVQRGRARMGESVYAAFPLRDEVTAVRIVEPVFLDKEGVRLRG